MINASESALQGELLYSKNYTQIKYFKEEEVIYISLLGKFTTEEYKDAFEVLRQHIIAQKPKGGIADQTYSGGSTMEQRAWLIMKWFPELNKQYKDKSFKIAGIRGAKIGLKKFISQYLENAIGTFTPYPVKSVDSLQEAFDWIKQ